MRSLIHTLFALAVGLVSNVVSADIAIVTSPDNGIESISFEDAQLLYLGRLSALRDRTPVQLIDLPPGEVRDSFYQRLTGRNPVQIRAYWSRMVFTGRARPPLQADSQADMIKTLQMLPHAIGYLPAASVTVDLRVLLTLPGVDVPNPRLPAP